MRDDMDKVIVERPRLKRSNRRINAGARQWRNDPDRSAHLGIKAGYRNLKWLNENLAPLKRWLHKQVDRPWDKVWSELSAGIDRRSAVQAHIFEHIDQFVRRDVQWVDGELRVPTGWGALGRLAPLREMPRITLFVHPVHGMLLCNPASKAKRVSALRQAVDPRPRHVVIDDWTQWHWIDGRWWELGLEPLPPPKGCSPQRCWDVQLRCWAVRGKAPPPGTLSAEQRFGRPNLYVASMRVLPRAEIHRRFPNGMPATAHRR